MAESLLVRKGGGGAKITGTEQTFVANETISAGDLVCNADVIESADVIYKAQFGSVGVIRHTRRIPFEKNRFLTLMQSYNSPTRLFYYKVNDDFTISLITDSGDISTSSQVHIAASDMYLGGIMHFCTSTSNSGINSNHYRVNYENNAIFSAVNNGFLTGSNAGGGLAPIRNFDNDVFSGVMSSGSTNRMFFTSYAGTNNQQTTFDNIDVSGNVWFILSDAIFCGTKSTAVSVTQMNRLQAQGQVNSTRAIFRIDSDYTRTNLYNVANFSSFSAFVKVPNVDRYIFFGNEYVSGVYSTRAVVLTPTQVLHTNSFSETIVNEDTYYVETIGNNFLTFSKERSTPKLILKNYSFSFSATANQNIVTQLKEIRVGTLVGNTGNNINVSNSNYTSIHKVAENHYLLTSFDDSTPTFKILKLTPRIKKAVTAEEKQKIIGVAKTDGVLGDTVTVIAV